MSSTDSVTRWLDELQAGDPAAAEKLWDLYFQRLVVLARAKLQGVPRSAADEEDVALSAFDSFCRGAEQGRFPKLDDRDNLWRLLVVITSRKALDLAQHEGRQKRGGAVLEAALPRLPDSSAMAGLDQFSSLEPTPEFAAQVAEQCQLLLDRELLVARCAAALPRGGRLLIHDALLNDDHSGPLYPALFSVALMVMTWCIAACWWERNAEGEAISSLPACPA